MTVYKIVPATLEHVKMILPKLREADRVELSRSGPFTVERQLELSVRCSWDAIAGFADDEILVLAGVASQNRLSGTGCPWMVATDELPKHAKKFLKEDRKLIEKWLTIFTRLENWVDNDNVVSQKWLKRLKFELEDPVAYGHQGCLFRRFFQERKECV